MSLHFTPKSKREVLVSSDENGFDLHNPEHNRK